MRVIKKKEVINKEEIQDNLNLNITQSNLLDRLLLFLFWMFFSFSKYKEKKHQQKKKKIEEII